MEIKFYLELLHIAMVTNTDQTVFLLCQGFSWPQEYGVTVIIYSQLSLSGHLSKLDSKFGPLPAELHLYLCNWTLSKADASLNQTVALVPRVSALERVDCI